MKRKHLLMQVVALAAAHLLAARAIYAFAPVSSTVPPASRHASLLLGKRQGGARWMAETAVASPATGETAA